MTTLFRARRPARAPHSPANGGPAHGGAVQGGPVHGGPVHGGPVQDGLRRGGFAATGLLIAAGLAVASLAGCSGAPSSGASFRGAIDTGPARLTQPPQPPEIVARTTADIADAASAVSEARLEQLMSRNGARKYEGAQLPLFFESEIGQAYLRSNDGRALARGAPSETCPAFGAALDAPDDQRAAAIALERCLSEVPEAAKSRCACRLLAAGPALLSDTQDFAYARAVHVSVVDRAGAWEASLIAEERVRRDAVSDPLDPARLDALAHGARSLWLIGPSGPVATLDFAADGAAEMRLLTGPRDNLREVGLLRGRWLGEGFRRGRLAKSAALRSDDGSRDVLVLIGYDPDELDARREGLVAGAAELLAETSAVSSHNGGDAQAEPPKDAL